MSRRFFAASPITSENATLTGQDAQHLSKVMRAKVGDEVIVFDGSGAEFSARVEKIGRSEVAISILEKREVDRELQFHLVIGVALPKGDRQRWLVEKLVELGVTKLTPLVTTRSVAQPNENALVRLRRGVVEASKQCGRNRLMTIGEAQPFASFIGAHANSVNRLIAHPAGDSEASATCDMRADDIAIAIGPEGGFSEDEIAAADERHWNRISLGPRILRTETAAVALASMVGCRCKLPD